MSASLDVQFKMLVLLEVLFYNLCFGFVLFWLFFYVFSRATVA